MSHIKSVTCGKDDTLDVVTQCPRCQNLSQINVPQRGYLEWRAGALIQIALPHLNSDQRECMISGCCHQCWEALNG